VHFIIVLPLPPPITGSQLPLLRKDNNNNNRKLFDFHHNRHAINPRATYNRRYIQLYFEHFLKNCSFAIIILLHFDRNDVSVVII